VIGYANDNIQSGDSEMPLLKLVIFSHHVAFGDKLKSPQLRPNRRTLLAEKNDCAATERENVLLLLM